jgi:hypothetical protein
MHAAISCASCSRPLRIPESLVGQTVRCPYCTDAFLAVPDPNIKLEEAVSNLERGARKAERQEALAAPTQGSLLQVEEESPVVEEAFTVDLAGPARPAAPPKAWSTWVFVKSDTDRRLWGEMQAEISAEGLRLYRGRKDLIVPVGCEATWVAGAVVRVVVGSRTVDFQLRKKHIYRSRLAADLAGFLNGDRTMPAEKGYGWPWYQWLLLLAPLGLLAMLFFGELPETSLKGLKGTGIFLLGAGGPILAYLLWNMERLRVGARWAGAGLLAAGAYVFSASMYLSGPHLPRAAEYASWYTYYSPDGRYSIQMPAATYTESEFTNGMTVFKTTARVQPNQTFIVAYADVAGSVSQPWERDSALNRGRQYALSRFEDSFLYGIEREINLDDHPGKEFDIGARGRGTGSARVYLVGNRLYILLTMETNGLSGYKFFDTFKVEGPARPDLLSPRTLGGLKAYWSFDAGEGGMIREDTNTLGQTPLHNCEWSKKGVRGGCIQLSGVANVHFPLGRSTKLNVAAGESFTFAGWFKTSQPDGVLVCLKNQLDPSSRILIILQAGRVKGFVRADGAGERADPAEVTQPNLTAAVNDGKWHHFALVRDAAPEANTFTLYLDGVNRHHLAVFDATRPITTDVRALGADVGSEFQPTPNFQGSIDEFCVFGRALRADEIASLAGR